MILNSNYEQQKQVDLLNFYSNEKPPDLTLNISPSAFRLDNIQMVSVLDGAITRTLHRVYGSKWKRRESPLVILNPEVESRKTIGSRFQFLHYHGGLWTKNDKLLAAFQPKTNTFKDLLKDELERRSECPDKWTPDVYVDKFNPDGNFIDYAGKNLSQRREFTNADTYIFGRSKTRQQLGTRSLDRDAIN